MPSRIRDFVNRLKGLSPRPSSTRSKKSVGSTTTSRSSSPNYDPSVDLATPRAPIVSFPDVVVEAVGLAHMSEDDAAVGIKVVDPEEQETTPARPPVRKAVLVGIQYKKVALLRCREASQSEKCEEDWGELDGTHQDVLTMKGLLTEVYGFAEEDIVCLLDDEEKQYTWPTKAKIQEAIKEMLKDCQSGDLFVFHYSGHGFQTPSRTLDSTEEDGHDEGIVTSDGQRIIDNDLRHFLVDPLKYGSTLVAIFDCCHSGTILDLPHYRCNQVYYPWISKGTRGSLERWENVGRKNAMASPPTQLSELNLNSMDSLTSAESSLANSFILSDPTAGISQTLLEVPGAPAPTHEIRRGRTARRQKRMAEDHQTRHSRSFSGNYFDDIEICESPVRKFCDGTCREASTALWIQRDDDSAECAHVVCLVACDDDELAWMDREGNSMTQAVVRFLRKERHPTLAQVLTHVGHALHRQYRALHADNKIYKKRIAEYNEKRRKQGKPTKDVETVETNNFRDPMFGSHCPLDLDEIWPL